MDVLTGGNGNARVWIENHPTEGWAPGRVDSVGSNGLYVVVDDQGTKFEVAPENARQVDPNCLRGVDDLLSLGDFNEGALLHNVRSRYFNDNIYTGIGSPILISVNPFQNLPGLYTEAKQKFYRERSAAAGSGEDADVPPHLFSVAAAAYTAMLGDARNQSIIISGESGAGKTEATKRILTYFANLQRTAGATSEKTSIEEQVLRSNPILEAFGNAKTIRNDNSSRFGKFIDIEFGSSGKLTSAKISNYLLEKSRIVKQQPDERGYHAFYQLCAGGHSLSDIGPTLGLRSAYEHSYTAVCTEIDGVDDASMLEEAADCMDGLGFSKEEKNSVFQIVAAVLHLGDMQFEEGDDGSVLPDGALTDKICELLKVSKADFTTTFQHKTLEDPFTKKIIHMPQDPTSSSNTRHSMAKHLYSRLFDWLVWRINLSAAGKGGGGGRKENTKKIGILDIYGFEVFEWNSFEQLCINFANEKLQQHFNSHMFTLEQQLYNEEGISWSHIEWQDNKEIIDQLERKPLGLFCILDSECLMPNATDDTCLSKIHSSFKSSRVVYKTSRFKSTNFAVAHYAGEVVYNVISFLEKNTDKLHADITNLLKSSSMPITRTLFSDPRFAPDMQAQAAQSRPGAPPAKRGEPNQRAKQNVTVSVMFRQQLDQLVEDLNRTNPRYIRCIKPNGNKQAHEMDSLDVQRQLRCAGMLESIRIRRAGYPVRRPFKEFFNRFRLLCPHVSTGRSLDPDYKELCRRVLTDVEAKFQAQRQPVEAKSWQVGRSKVFLKEELQGRLEKALGEAVKVYVVRMQKRWRGSRARRKYRVMRGAAVQVQALLRTLRSASEFQKRLQQHREARAALLTAEAELPSLRSGLAAADEQLPEERCVPAEKDMELIQLEASAAQVARRERDAQNELRECKDELEAAREAAEAAERRCAQKESSHQWLQKENERLKAALLSAEAELPSLRSGLTTADRQLLEAKEESRASQQRCVRAEEDMELIQRQLKQLEASAAQVARRERDAQNELRECKDELEAARETADAAERRGAQKESSHQWLQKENERLKAKEESRASQQRCVRAEEDMELIQRQLKQLEASAAQVARRERDAQNELRECKDELEAARETADAAERRGAQKESSHQWLQKENERLKAALLSAEAELPSLRSGLTSADQQLLEAKEESRASQQRCMRAEEDMELIQRQLKQLEASSAQVARRERDAQNELRECKDELEAARETADAAERRGAQKESSHQWLQKENERLKAALLSAEAELPSFRLKLTTAEEQLLEAKEESRASQQRCMRAEEDMESIQRQLKQLEASAAQVARRERDAQNELRECKDELEAAREAADAAGRRGAQKESSHQWLQKENERLKAELADSNAERAKMRQQVDEVLKKQQDCEVDKWKQAAHFEREYGKAKVLIADYEKELGKAALAVSGDASQTKALQQQLEKYHQELRTIRMERDDAQHKLDENESAGEFFKERYRTAQDELRQLKQENAHLSATTDKLKQRLQNAAQSDDVLGTGLDSQESMQKIQKLTDEMKRVQAWGMKSKQLADCLNQLLALESAQTKLYEQTCDIKDFGVIGEIQRRKDQAEAIRRQCDQLMSNSIA
ncbi:unnamed protein product [Effrenium voratum]|uniref:Myosin motor domain-containing protein n=1 Tax=Effrenium voratum TaxID=2562239 RepID=A0AA36IMU4_9DINO|nr:unnamed protein product [Effrenium voratum]